MNITIDLSNNTDIDKFFGVSLWTIIYIHLQFWIFTPVALVGNTIVIYTSLKYESLNMDRVSCALLENLAAADLVLMVVGGLPIYITFCANSWKLGQLGCFLNFYITLAAGVCEIVTLAAISLYRAVSLKNPFLFRGISDRKIRIGIVCLWIISSIMPLTSYFLESVIFYEPTEMSCSSTVYDMPDYGLLALFFLLFLLPMCTILISNIVMLIVSVRYRRRMSESSGSVEDRNMTAVMTVTCVCWLFLVSWLPYIFKIFCRTYSVDLPIGFFIFQAQFFALNLALNPVIYTLTNKSFKAVVEKRVLGKVLSVFGRTVERDEMNIREQQPATNTENC